ncbi:MAG: electron transfer flavoprotein subunit beta/FixA family protein [bacterium]
MRVVVWVREIPDTRDLIGEILGQDSMPKWDDWDTRIDPEDLNSLEMALQWKDRDPRLEVTAVSVGEPKKLDVLRECLYRGVDQVVRLSGEGQPQDLLWEARLLAGAVRRLDAQVVFTGVQLNETECGHKGVFLAHALGWPVATYVEALEQGELGGPMKLRRAVEQGVELVEATPPLVISVGVALLKDDPRAPRSARAKLKLQHKKTQIPQWQIQELGSFLEQRSGGGTRILAFRSQPQRDFPARRVDGSSQAELKAMVDELRNQGLVR